MKSVAKLFALLALAFVLLTVVPGCTDTKEAATFNDQVITALKRIQPAAEHFGRTVGPALNNQPGSMDEVRRPHKAVKDILTGIRAEAKTWKVPEKASAKALFASYEKFMTTQDEAVNVGFSDVVKILEDKKLAPQQKAKSVETIPQTTRSPGEGSACRVGRHAKGVRQGLPDHPRQQIKSCVLRPTYWFFTCYLFTSWPYGHLGRIACTYHR